MDSEFERHYQRANQLYDDGCLDEAARLYQKLLDNSPNGYADIHNRLGLIHSQKGLTERAAEAFEKALAINPRYTEAALNLFVTYNDLQRFADAERVFSRAAAEARHAQLDPFVVGKLANEHARLGDTYRQIGCRDEALAEYRKALALRPTFADVLAKVGVVLRELGRIDEAIAAFDQAKQSNPAYVPSYIHLGVTYYTQGRFSQAAREWNAAQALDPSNRAVQAYVALGNRKAK